VLAALPCGARPALRLCCRAGRAAVDGHTRRLRVMGRGLTLLSPAAVARMPLLQEADLTATDDTAVLALADTLRALRAQLRRATVAVLPSSGSALGRLYSALASLSALTRLELRVDLGDPASWAAPPLVLPWASMEVGVAAARGEGCHP
jgi:hypothetical protein